MVGKAVRDLGVEKAGLVPSAPLLSCHAGSAKQQFLCSGTGFSLQVTVVVYPPAPEASLQQGLMRVQSKQEV